MPICGKRTSPFMKSLVLLVFLFGFIRLPALLAVKKNLTDNSSLTLVWIFIIFSPPFLPFIHHPTYLDLASLHDLLSLVFDENSFATVNWWIARIKMNIWLIPFVSFIWKKYSYIFFPPKNTLLDFGNTKKKEPRTKDLSNEISSRVCIEGENNVFFLGDVTILNAD